MLMPFFADDNINVFIADEIGNVLIAGDNVSIFIMLHVKTMNITFFSDEQMSIINEKKT
jgi:uncharacterized Zn ribbon protein